jgi:phage tail protein X
MSAADTYVTTDDDMIDRIAFRHYGRHEGTVEHVLAHNRHLTAYGPHLPAGITIMLPPLPAADPRSALVRLWD